jgi:hypothetical protein
MTMDEPGLFLRTVTLLATIAAALAIPLIVERLGARLVERLAPAELRHVPIVLAFPRLLGLILGVVLVFDRFDGHDFDFQQLFAPDGPWRESFGQFLADTANPAKYRLGALAAIVAPHPATPGAVALLAVTVAAAVGTLAAPFAFWRPPVALRVAVRNVAVAIVATYLTIYAIVVLYWLIGLLNFWIFALAAAVFQYYRSRI